MQNQETLSRTSDQYFVLLSYGGGVNSTALLVGLEERDERPDAILFSDTGGEKPGTYQHIERMQELTCAAQVMQNIRGRRCVLKRDAKRW